MTDENKDSSSNAASDNPAELTPSSGELAPSSADEKNMLHVVVKAASQCMPDLDVACEQTWTVKDLKTYLHEHHPIHPALKEQRLIYSGHLLTDEMLISAELRDDNSVLHLVCAPQRQSSSSSSSSAAPVESTSQQQSNTNSSNTAAPASSDQHITSRDGVRQRNTDAASAPSSTSTDSPVGPSRTHDPVANHQWTNDYAHILQQTYYEQYMAYMRLYNSGNGGLSATTEGSSTDPTTSQYNNFTDMNAAFSQVWQQIYGHYPTVTTDTENAAVPDYQPEDRPVQAAHGENVNAPAAMAFVEAQRIENDPVNPVAFDDGDGAAHDWLDSVYIFARISILVCCIYFYASVYRFLFIVTVAVLIYLYNVGWFRPARQLPQADLDARRRDQDVGLADAQRQQHPAGPAEQQPQAAPPLPSIPRENNIDGPAAPTNNADEEERHILDMMDDRNNNIPNNNNNNDVPEVVAAANDVNAAQPERSDATPAQSGEAPEQQTPQGANDQLPLQEQPSFLAVSWTFLSTFFTSLLPEQPEML